VLTAISFGVTIVGVVRSCDLCLEMYCDECGDQICRLCQPWWQKNKPANAFENVGQNGAMLLILTIVESLFAFNMSIMHMRSVTHNLLRGM